jgi:hypothetical protein
MFEHGVCELQFFIHNSAEMFGTAGNFLITALSSETGEMLVRLEKPMRAEVNLNSFLSPF